MRFRNKLRPGDSPNQHLLSILRPAKTLSYKRRLLFEQLSTRQVLADVSGIVFEDTNLSWRPEPGETRLQSRVVYIDENNNSQLDNDEQTRLTDALGQFEFADLTSDQAILRLFQGSESVALPLFPVTPNADADLIAISGGTGIANFDDDIAITVAGDRVERSDLGTGESTSAAIPASVRAAELLPDGRILVLASENQANHAFIIDSAGDVSPLALQTPAPTNGWADVAIDASGKGLLVEQSAAETLLRSISIGAAVTVTNSTVSVGAGTKVVSGGATTTVVSTPTDDGLLLRLWSNATGTEITSGGVEVLAGQEVLSYDDASGLVLLRTTADTVQLLDADANFASLQTISGVAGPVALDASREVLFAVSAANATLQIIDINTAAVLSQLAIQASAGASDIAFDSTTGKLLLLTSAGIKPIALDRADSHLIKTTAGSPSFPVLFALAASAGQNTAPRFDSLPELTTPEDTPLIVPVPELFEDASDAENDKFIALLHTQTENGFVKVLPNGGLTYSPNRDFFGVDKFKVILTDGRDASEPIELSILVTPVEDVFGITITPNNFPEYVLPNFLAGAINIINGGTQITWFVDDPRFLVEDERLIIAAGSTFDFETEPTVTVVVTATDVASGSVASDTVIFQIGDEDDPILDIKPDTASVDENRPGELIAEITVIDEGTSQEYTFEVDDDRFTVDFRDLRLKPGISLDFEAESSVTVNVTATSAGGRTKTEPIAITVKDIGEQISTLDLSPRQVKELVRGAGVGNLIVDGNPLPAGLIATVNDTRFEIIGKQLKLRPAEFVRLADQEEIEVRITVQDASANFLPITGTFILEVLENLNPFHNPNNQYDVNDDGKVTALDALLIINSISRNGGIGGPISIFPSPDRFYDVNGDGRITPLDALLIINFLNRIGRGTSEGESQETEPTAGNLSAPSFSPLGGKSKDDEVDAAVSSGLF